MDAIELPTPPPLPPVPVPMTWDYRSAEGREQARLHRLAVLHDACPKCVPEPGHPTRRDWLAELAEPRPQDEPRPGEWLTPEGEHASFVHGRFEVHDADAFERWAGANFPISGQAFAHTVTVGTVPWTRALFWFEDEGVLRLEASSLDRYLHLAQVFEHMWPPVFRGSWFLAGLDDRLDQAFRPHWPQPPAEASAFTALHRIPDGVPEP